MPTNPTRLTPAREAEIRALVDALPREHWVQEMEQDLSLCPDGTAVPGKPYPVGRVTAFYEYDAGNGTIGEDEREVATFDATRDAAFFIAAPNALRDLLAEVEALRADAERLAVEAEGADIAAVVLSDDRDELRDVLRDLLEGLDWWGVDPTDREFPSDTIRTARAVLDSLNPYAARATEAPTTPEAP